MIMSLRVNVQFKERKGSIASESLITLLVANAPAAVMNVLGVPVKV